MCVVFFGVRGYFAQILVAKLEDKDQKIAECDERQFFAVDTDAPRADSALETLSPNKIAPDSDQLNQREVFVPQTKSEAKRRTFKAIDIYAFLAMQLRYEEAQGTAFLLIPVVMIAGVTTYFSLPAEPAAHNIPIAVLAIAMFRIAIRKADLAIKYAINALLVFVMAMGLAQCRTIMIDTKMLGSEVSTRLTGRIVSIEQRPNGSVRYTLDVIATDRPKLRYAPTRIRATTRKPVATATIGEGLYGYVRLSPPSGPVRPNAFDFAFNNYFQSIGANGFFLGQPRAIVLPNQSWQPSVQIEKTRLWLAQRIRDQNQGRAGTVSAALITGDKAAIPESVNEMLRTSGLAHILSISGLHMALVAGTVMFALRAIFALSPKFSAYVPAKKYAAIVGFGAIFIYLFLAGASVATQRSFIMLAVMLGALLSDRSALTMRNLAIAAIVIILIAPEAVLGPSFQMSFAATLALIAAYAAWTRKRIKYLGNDRSQQSLGQNLLLKSGGFIGGLSMTSIIAGTATGIFAAYHFQRVAVLGLLGNLLAMPIVSIITMPAAILATLLIPVGLDGYVYAVMNWSVENVILIANFVAARAPSGLVGAMTPGSLLLLTCSLMVMCVLQSKLKYLGILFLLPAYFVQSNQELPHVIISEDARQIAVINHGQSLAVNRARPNKFIVEQWQSAYKAEQILKPKSKGGFHCKNKEYCSFDYANDEGKPTIFYTQNARSYEGNSNTICEQYDIIVLAYAPATNKCEKKSNAHKSQLIITAQQLALYGSAEITAERRSNKTQYKAEFTLGEAARPWQSHRKFSRSARNLAPIVRKN